MAENSRMTTDQLIQVLSNNRDYLKAVLQMLRQDQATQMNPQTIEVLINEIEKVNKKADAVITAVGSTAVNPQMASSINAFNLYNFANIEEEMEELVKRVNQGYAINLTRENMQQLVDALQQTFKMPLDEVIKSTLSIALKDALQTMLEQVTETNQSVKRLNEQVTKMEQAAERMQQQAASVQQTQTLSLGLVAVLCILLGLIGQMNVIFKLVAIIMGVVIGIIVMKPMLKGKGKAKDVK